MKITVLIENTTNDIRLQCEHGLSFFIETKKRKILFDFGASNLFLENAKELAIDLKKVRLAFLSHGHYDHGGGIEAFLGLNDKAKIYASKYIFKDYFGEKNGEKRYIGLDKNLEFNQRFVYLSESSLIEDGVEVLLNIPQTKQKIKTRHNLYEKKNKEFFEDSYRHEMNLVLDEDGKKILITGCGHAGIVNILEAYKNRYKKFPDIVVGGLHLYKYCEDAQLVPPEIAYIGEYLRGTSSKFYTCHCTGIESFNYLKEILGDKIDYLETGKSIEI